MSTGAILDIAPVSKFTLQQANMGVPEPSVPRIPHPTYNPDGDPDGEWLEDPFSPEYQADVDKAREKRVLLTISTILNHAVTIAELPAGSGRALSVFERRSMDTSQMATLQAFAVRTKEDLSSIVNAAAVTESRVQRFFDGLQVVRNGEPIDQAGLRNAIDVGIRSASITIGDVALVGVTEEYEACIASAMDWHQWTVGRYSLDFMAQTIALHRATVLKSLHTNDAVQQAAKDKQKK